MSQVFAAPLVTLKAELRAHSTREHIFRVSACSPLATLDGALQLQVRVVAGSAVQPEAAAKVADLTFDVGHATGVSAIELLWVQPAFQRMGLGDTLYRFVEAVQRNAHTTPFTSCIVDPKSTGLGFWQKKGYAINAAERRFQLGEARSHCHEQHGYDAPGPAQAGQLAMERQKQ